MIVLRCAVPATDRHGAQKSRAAVKERDKARCGRRRHCRGQRNRLAERSMDSARVRASAIPSSEYSHLVSSPAVLFKACTSLALLTVARLNWSGNINAVVFTFNVITEEAPAARPPPFGFVQLAPPVTALQVQPVPVPEAKLIPAGSVSVTVMVPLMVACPTFFTVIV